MAQDNKEIETVEKLKKNLKPKLYWPIWNTIICSGPPLNLIFRYFLVRDIKNPTIAIIFTVIAMVFTIINWYWYVKERKDFKKNWEKISIELQALNLQEEPSKDIIGAVFDKLMITAIASLVMFFIFAAIVIFAEILFFRYLALFCIIVFFIAMGVLIIVCVIQLCSLIRDLMKSGRLKKVLKRFILIYTLSLIILIIISFITHKNFEWVKVIINSLLMTLPISIFTEAAMLYKEIKKEYSSHTSHDESDSK